jgi:putative ABC transport system substrate-binding protein
VNNRHDAGGWLRPIKRRSVLAGIAAATVWPLGARAQQRDGRRVLAVLVGNALNADDPAAQRQIQPFQKAMAEAGWIGTIHIEYRFAAGDAARFETAAAEIVASSPDVIYALNLRSVLAVRQKTNVIPIVFSEVVDPVGARLVARFVRPGGNVTGFVSNEIETAGKWIQFLEEIAPRLSRVGTLYNPDLAPYADSFVAAGRRAAGAKMPLVTFPASTSRDLDKAVASLSRGGGGLWVIPDPFTSVNLAEIIAQCGRLRVPAIYPFPASTRDGGLISYAFDFDEQMRQPVSYISRILHGESPAELPVQAPTKYVLFRQPQDRESTRSYRAAVTPRRGGRGDRMRRREFIVMVGGLAVAWPRASIAQTPAHRPLVGMLYPASEEVAPPNIGAFRARIAELGYVEGRDFDLAIRYAPARTEQENLRLAGELIAMSPTVLVVATSSTTVAVQKLAPTTPLVGVNMDDAVALGLVTSIAHPGGNVTGLTYASSAALPGKQLALLKELSSSIVRVGALLAADDAQTAHALAEAAAKLGLALRSFPIALGEELATTTATAAIEADALYFGPGPLFNTYRTEIARLVANTRRPAIYSAREYVLVGGLMAYGPSVIKAYALAADYVAKILGGAKPADLPVQQPELYQLVINLKTAKTLGITIPPTLLALADEVIE